MLLTTYLEKSKVRETSMRELKSSLYGLARLVTGHKDWKRFEETHEEQRIQALLEDAIEQLASFARDPRGANQQDVSHWNRRLRAYQQLRTLERFCFDEVDWDESERSS